MGLRVLAWVVLSVLACTGGVKAAEFWVRADTCEKAPCTTPRTIELSGPIVRGDAKRFEELLEKEGPSISGLALRSPGGNVDEAMRIGRLVRRKLLRTLAPTDGAEGKMCFISGSPEISSECVCLSSCFLIHSAGVFRAGHVLGLHRPRYDEAFFGKLPLDEANRQYESVIERIKAYLIEMDVGDRYLNRMLRVSSSEMEIVTAEDAERDFNGFSPAIAEWLKAKCGEVSEKERKSMSDLGFYMVLKDAPYAKLDDEQRAYVANMARHVTPDMERQYQRYSQRETEVTHCRNAAMYEEREKRYFEDMFAGVEKPKGATGNSVKN